MRPLIGFLLAISVAIGGTARAADFPTHPVTLIVGYTPGASTDLSARILASAMSAGLGQTVVVVNKPGAAAAIASEFVARAAPDGYTLLYGTADCISVLPAVKPSVPYHIADDFTYIARDAQFPFVLAVSSRLPFRSVDDLVAYAKANPNRLRSASPGSGSNGHILTLMLGQDAGIQMVHVPYRGAEPATVDLLGGVVDMIFDTQSHITPFAETGKVRLLAVTTPTRTGFIPDVPTMTEAGHPAIGLTGWFGVMGPARMPAAVSDRLQQAVQQALAEPELQERFAKAGIPASYLGGADFRNFAVDAYEKTKAIADANHIRIED